MTKHKELSDVTAATIDSEVKGIIDRNYDRAEKILRDNMDTLHAMADALIRYETLDADQIKDIMSGNDPHPPADWSDDETMDSSSGAATRKEETDPSKSDGSTQQSCNDDPVKGT